MTKETFRAKWQRSTSGIVNLKVKAKSYNIVLWMTYIETNTCVGVRRALYELERLELIELLEEAEYYQLLVSSIFLFWVLLWIFCIVHKLVYFLLFQGLVGKINEVLLRKGGEQTSVDLTRTDIIKYVRPSYVKHVFLRLRGTNLSGLDLSKLVWSKFKYNLHTHLYWHEFHQKE